MPLNKDFGDEFRYFFKRLADMFRTPDPAADRVPPVPEPPADAGGAAHDYYGPFGQAEQFGYDRQAQQNQPALEEFMAGEEDRHRQQEYFRDITYIMKHVVDDLDRTRLEIRELRSYVETWNGPVGWN